MELRSALVADKCSKLDMAIYNLLQIVYARHEYGLNLGKLSVTRKSNLVYISLKKGLFDNLFTNYRNSKINIIQIF